MKSVCVCVCIFTDILYHTFSELQSRQRVRLKKLICECPFVLCFCFCYRRWLCRSASRVTVTTVCRRSHSPAQTVCSPCSSIQPFYLASPAWCTLLLTYSIVLPTYLLTIPLLLSNCLTLFGLLSYVSTLPVPLYRQKEWLGIGYISCIQS